MLEARRPVFLAELVLLGSKEAGACWEEMGECVMEASLAQLSGSCGRLWKIVAGRAALIEPLFVHRLQ